MNTPKSKFSPVLAALAALCTAGAAMAAGVTTTGMLVRVAVAAAGFWAVGLGLDRVLAWAIEGVPTKGVAGGADGQGAKGQRLDVRLPAIAPGTRHDA